MTLGVLKLIYFIYDGSFEGFLTTIYEAYYREENPDKIIKTEDYEPDLFSQKINIETEEEKADKVYEAIEDKISSASLRKIYHAFLSEIDNIETDIYKYIQLGFKLGSNVDKHLTEDRVYKIQKISKKVGKEKHRLKGLLRFRKIKENMFYAPVEPDYNIIALLAPHFEKRLTNQNWIIHDRKRSIAVLYNTEESVITELEDIDIDYKEEELFYQKLWQEFFNTIEIKNRKNPELQKQYMPQRYWKYLVENAGK